MSNDDLTRELEKSHREFEHEEWTRLHKENQAMNGFIPQMGKPKMPPRTTLWGYDPKGRAQVYAIGENMAEAALLCGQTILEYVGKYPDAGPISKWTIDHPRIVHGLLSRDMKIWP
ncbi:MAG TPA: hypothetical protein ENH62_16210 [Marinobacter sp.]|uniref:Uncharacterized protein n=1 Tax=marine sediment metagenome TaxID=412755 RepID=A0A0F9IXJ8_9ZZZZ|nr:hypothetical protein [Marinobacter sp.]